MRSPTAALALLLALPAAALAAPTRGAAATASNFTVAISLYAPCLELELPRAGAYAQALDAVHRRAYRRARELFLAATVEVRRAAERAALSWPRARTLIAKCEFAADQAERLRQAARDEGQPRPWSRRLDEALALHNLYLTARAYAGRDDRPLYDRAAAAYVAALAGTAPGLVGAARLAYAALLALGGRERQAREEYARVPAQERESSELALVHAHFLAALGDLDGAFARLATAADSQPGWRRRQLQLRASNDFDRLRDDPRFPALLGDDD